MRRRTLITLLSVILLATALGLVVFSSPSTASQQCNCNIAANNCLANQTCVDCCDCVSLHPDWDGVCQ